MTGELTRRYGTIVAVVKFNPSVMCQRGAV